MGKVLKATFKKNCIGCELCIFEAQRQLNKVGLEGSPIRVFREKRSEEKTVYSIDIDPKVNKIDLEKIVAICPTMVFTIEEEMEEQNEFGY
uniref:Ferredoxin n=1 Tax=candidate division WWE3 bacterium TaxID=2053526 RepID=A0A7C4Y2N3_UNCKA